MKRIKSKFDSKIQHRQMEFNIKYVSVIIGKLLKKFLLCRGGNMDEIRRRSIKHNFSMFANVSVEKSEESAKKTVTLFVGDWLK